MSLPFATGGRDISEHEARNRDIVLDYYEKLIGRWDFDAASEHLGDHFIQHNPTMPDGLAGLERWVRNVPPPIADAMQHRIARVLVDGDMVILHVKVSLTAMPDSAIVDMFRLENGKIVEHWDVIQPVPSEHLHGNGMF
ncbi:nuclear transport factor 2 family protein [Novosphingobium sp.]|uniref:nuclear transport factor 2 family protein n=1 Tax=Novosphingobium sp. TaxID=1874826 RepID=UPI002622984D|nr:nuclear transport factor 2 family protein [Novosphingobium sp.]